jgi:hypothetical protein
MANLKPTDAVIVELFDNLLTQRNDDRYGRVVNIASVNDDVLIKRAIANGFNGNAASMRATIEAINNEILQAVVRGEIVNHGIGHIALDVEGAFIGDNPSWNAEVNKLTARITPSKALREALKNTPVRVRGMAQDSSNINFVTDVTTGNVNATLTAGGMANIKGTRIKIVGDLATVGLFLTNQDTQAVVQVPMTAIGINDPSTVSFVVPATLPAGNYLLSIGTQYTGSAKALKELKTIILNYILTIG